MRPYPPSFSSMAARIIDPATGASTWAFGNQRWKPYTGIFIRKATIVINHHSSMGTSVLISFCSIEGKGNIVVFCSVCIRSIEISRGRDPNKV